MRAPLWAIIHSRPSIIALLLILLHAGLLSWSAVKNSVAVDEFAHLPAGVAYWHGKFSIYDLSPPLLRMIGAFPAMIGGATYPPAEPFEKLAPKDRHWSYAYAFMTANADQYQRLFVLGRMAMMVVSCFGAWIVYRWASAVYGSKAALLSCAVYVLCPNLLAHGSLVGTDSGTAVALLLAVWMWWRFCRSLSMRDLVLAAVTVGIAHLCKFTALLLWPMLAGMTIVLLPDGRRLRWAALPLLLCMAVTLLIVNAGYGFESMALPIPLPRSLVEGFMAQRWEFQQGMASYLFGRQYAGSRWYYYPIALVLKVPVMTVGFFALALLQRRFTRDEASILVAAAIFLLGAMFLSGADLGVRYVLPVLPLAFIIIGRIKLKPWLATTLCALLLLRDLAGAPYFLSSFSVFSGGPDRGQTMLNDSNFDWGTGLLALHDWMQKHHVQRVQLGYFGRVDPAIYGIDYDLLTQKSGEPYVAISSHFLVGLPYRLPGPNGPTGWISLPFHEQLRAKPRVAVIAGGTIHIFRREDVAKAMNEFQLTADERR